MSQDALEDEQSSRFPVWLMAVIGLVVVYLVAFAVIAAPERTAPLTPEQERQQQEETSWWLLIGSNF